MCIRDRANGVPMGRGVRSIARGGGEAATTTQRFSTRVLCADLANKKMHPFINEVHVRSLDEAGDLAGHPGEEFLYVLDGSLVLHTEYYAPLLLEAGDSIYFDGNMRHAYAADGKGPARFLVLTTDEAGAHPIHDEDMQDP